MNRADAGRGGFLARSAPGAIGSLWGKDPATGIASLAPTGVASGSDRLDAAAQVAASDGAGERPDGRKRRRWFPFVSLTAQFSAVSSGVLLLGMLVQGAWISATIEDKAKFHAGSAAAMFVDHVIAPYFATRQPQTLLSEQHHQAIADLMRRASERMHIAAMKIWSLEGTILYSSNARNIGQSFVPTAALRDAMAGAISVEFDILEDEESAWERSIGIPLIEVYVPIRDAAGTVVAVAEFYENAEALAQELTQSKRATWMVTGAVFLAMITSLLVIVTRGSRLIDRQRHSLTDKITEMSMLQGRLERASRLAAEESEQYLRRLAADLHDGAAQLISFALLRLAPGTKDCAVCSPERCSELLAVRAALTDAMDEVRSICAGLSMPGIASLPCADAIASIVRDHERRTDTVVDCGLMDLPSDMPHVVKSSLCRFVQEGLNNAFRHAGGVGQSVTARMSDGTVVVEVADRGQGSPSKSEQRPGGSLGLLGLSDRLEGLGGHVEFRSVPGTGTKLTATMPLSPRNQEGHP